MAETKSSTKQGFQWNSRWVIGGVLFVLAVIFILENRQPVSIRLLIPVVTMPQWAALTIMLVIGLIIGLLIRRKR